MKRFVLVLFAIAVSVTSFAEEGYVNIKCSVCNGTGKLVLDPPDMGQHGGNIEYKKFWSKRIQCTICNGTGRRHVRSIKQAKPNDELDPCTKCGWTGTVECRKCNGSGIVDCKERDCKHGWIITKQTLVRTGNNHPKVIPPSIEPCKGCKGVGKVLCYECHGERATICPKCHGVGGKPKKERPGTNVKRD